ncbi:hypothetical protein KAR34_12990 [bacterium]|nr:hypothetical protein [bacterium]
MRPSVHVTVSIIGGVLVGSLLGSWQAAACSVFSGVLVDLDHVVEYFGIRRKWVSIRDFFEFWMNYKEPRLYLFFHGIEYILILAGAAWLGVAPAITGGLAFGLFHHLLLDQFGNGIRPVGYFLLVRWAWKFKSERIFIAQDTVPTVKS